MTKLPDNLEKWIEEKWPVVHGHHSTMQQLAYQEAQQLTYQEAAAQAILYLLNDCGVMECLEANRLYFTSQHLPSKVVSFKETRDYAAKAEALNIDVLKKINGGEGE